MKKTKLFTSLAALALVLGLGACETTSEEETTPSESEGTTETTDTTTEGGEEEGGNEGGEAEPRSVLGALDTTNHCYKYFDGTAYTTSSGSFINVTDDWDKAVDVTLTEETDGVAISFESEEGTKYFYYNPVTSGNSTTHNIIFSDEPYYWYYDAVNGVYETSEGGRFLGLQDGGASIRTYAYSNLETYSHAEIYEYEPEAPEAPDVPNLEAATSIANGGVYYLGYENETNGLAMFNGSAYKTYELIVSYESSADQWVEVTASGNDTDGYKLSFTDSTGTSRTIYAWLNGSYNELYFAATDGIDSTVAGVADGASCLFFYDSTNDYITTTINSTQYAISVDSSYANELKIDKTESSTGVTWAHLYSEVEAA